MIRIFPYDKQEIIIDIPKKDLTVELKKNIQLTGYIPFIKNKKSKRLYGTINSTTWKIKLKTTYRNSFKPVIYLKLVEVGENSTKMILEYKLHIVVRIFMIIFLIFPISIIVNNIMDSKDFEDYYFPIGIISALMIISNWGFLMSSGHAELTINKILNKIITTANTG